jgi:hypothetical protein
MNKVIFVAAFVAVALAVPLSAAAQDSDQKSPDPETMAIEAIVPAIENTTVRVEVLDPVTITNSVCVESATSRSANGKADESAASIVIPSSCTEGKSGNMRICWTKDDCVGFEFVKGQAVNLGQLKSEFFLPEPPATGVGPAHVHEDSRLARLLQVAALSTIIGATAMVALAFVLWKLQSNRGTQASR